MARAKKILISIISHNHNKYLVKILGDLNCINVGQRFNFRIIITINIPEQKIDLSQFKNISIKVIENSSPKGFGANNNQAFEAEDSDFFLVLNPDARIYNLEFEYLMSVMESNRNLGVLGVQVVNSSGYVQDSFREYPSFKGILNRVLTKLRGGKHETPNLKFENGLAKVDWVAGMFMFFVSDSFSEIGGFDERYFMYLEDADICRRMNVLGKSVVYTNKYEIYHDAQRATFKNLKHLKWHIQSMIRFLIRKV